MSIITRSAQIIRAAREANPRKEYSQTLEEMTRALASEKLCDKSDITQVMAWMLTKLDAAPKPASAPPQEEVEEAAKYIDMALYHRWDEHSAEIPTKHLSTILTALVDLQAKLSCEIERRALAEGGMETLKARVGELEDACRDRAPICKGCKVFAAAERKTLTKRAERAEARCDALDWLVEVQELRMHRIRNAGSWAHRIPAPLLKDAWRRRDSSNHELRATHKAALAAVEG